MGSAQDKPRYKNWWVWAIVILIVVLAVTQTPLSTTTSKSSYDIKAITAAQGIVEEYLLSPTSAKFPRGSGEYQVSVDGYEYQIIGYVDSDNAFGTSIRNDFIVSLEFSPDYKSWTPLYLQLGDQILIGGDE